MQNSPFVSGDGGIVINEAGLVRRGKGNRQEVGGRVFDEAFVVSVDEGYLFHLWCGVYSRFHQIR
ncbi:hypothetical protein C7I36_09455 [Zobellella taiwanensis]|uniref:Uncharacterized protein n=1 Tax=Zobellella taiwanensis TaxID=347535 RepID=A0A2P7QX02_9GAMM|nr:hypothetical protein [Zobellella taiwanensis]PSJ42498.1 hypothetical protein C7I36_09455 [Zobellella taiwanensis]